MLAFNGETLARAATIVAPMRMAEQNVRMMPADGHPVVVAALSLMRGVVSQFSGHSRKYLVDVATWSITYVRTLTAPRCDSRYQI
jgi:hypothetical protein